MNWIISEYVTSLVRLVHFIILFREINIFAEKFKHSTNRNWSDVFRQFYVNVKNS